MIGEEVVAGVPRVRRNAVALLAGRVASAATTLVALVILGRLRGAETLGVVGIGFALGSIAAIVSDGGASSLVIREVSRSPARAPLLLGVALAYRAVLAPALVALVWLVAIVAFPSNPLPIVLVAAGLIAQQAAELPRSFFNAHQRMLVSGGQAVVENVTWLAVIAILAVAGLPIEVVFGGALAVMIGSFVVGLILVDRLLGIRPRRPTRGELAAIVPLAAPFAAFAAIGITYSRLDPLLIGLLATGPAIATAGSFFAAARLIAAFEFVPDALSRAIYPEVSRRIVDAPARVVSMLGTAAATLLAIGAAAPAVLIPAGSWIMGLLFGSQAGRDGWILGALALAVPIRYLAYLFGMTLTSADAQGRRVAAAGTALGFVVIVDVIGIPRVGLIAPIISSIGAAMIMLGLYATFVRRRLGSTGLRAAVVVPLALAGLVATLSGIAASQVLPEVGAALVAALVYGALVVAGPARSLLRPQRPSVPVA